MDTDDSLLIGSLLSKFDDWAIFLLDYLVGISLMGYFFFDEYNLFYLIERLIFLD